MRYKSQIQFSSWDQVIETVTSKGIAEDDITNEVFIEDIKIIASVAHSTFFSRPISEDIQDLINQIHHYDPARARVNPEISYAFIEDVHKVACLIRELQNLPNSKKLLEKSIFSHEGMYVQFLLTVLLSRHFNVVDMEINNKPLNTDIVIALKDLKLHIHVKDIREDTKLNRVEDSIWAINSVLRDKAYNDKLDDKMLHVAKLDGAPPVEANEPFWINYAQGLENKPQKVEVVFKPEDGFTLSKETKVKMELVWRPHNHTYTSPTAGFNNTRLLMTKYDELEAKIAEAKPEEDEVHILLVVTDDEYDWDEFRDNLDDQPAGILFCSVHGFYIQHSPFILPSKYKSVDEALNKVFPSQPYWSAMSDKEL
jgi:hypothetical protein